MFGTAIAGIAAKQLIKKLKGGNRRKLPKQTQASRGTPVGQIGFSSQQAYSAAPPPVVGEMFTPGERIEIVDESDYYTDPVTGFLVKRPKPRRRRRRMLTCSDRQDISFLTATLGKGDMAKSAIAALLSGCNR